MSKTEKGFTLVELAVVMIVVGLLVGGVLMGVTMVENARVNAVIKQVNETDAAINTFFDKYRAKPGDALRADTQITGCNGANNCEAGDGNQLVAYVSGDEINFANRVTRLSNSDESVQFWKHLALADIISGINTGADPDEGWAWGTTHPTSAVGGGFEFYYDNWMETGGGGTSNAAGHVMRLSADGIDSDGIEGAVNTVNAQAIDKKMDDGDPSSGVVLADYGQENNDCKTTEGESARYNANLPSNTCTLFFRPFSR